MVKYLEGTEGKPPLAPPLYIRESTKPQVEFWSKESKNRQTDGQPGPVT